MFFKIVQARINKDAVTLAKFGNISKAKNATKVTFTPAFLLVNTAILCDRLEGFTKSAWTSLSPSRKIPNRMDWTNSVTVMLT